MYNTEFLGAPFSYKDTKLCMERKVWKRLLAEAQEAFPYEYSAMLTGHKASITGFISMPQASQNRHSFAWDGPSFLRALSEIQQANVQWLGVLHTHPNSRPIPSAHDQAGWHYPALSYWIVGLASAVPECKVYQWIGQEFAERPYTITDVT